jgi:hypothetical protein
MCGRKEDRKLGMSSEQVTMNKEQRKEKKYRMI